MKETQAFPNRRPRLQFSVMALFRRYDSEQFVRATGDLSARVQRLETEHARSRARLQGERRLLASITHIAAAPRTAPPSAPQSSDSLEHCSPPLRDMR